MFSGNTVKHTIELFLVASVLLIYGDVPSARVILGWCSGPSWPYSNSENACVSTAI